jgi:hypothetical protein
MFAYPNPTFAGTSVFSFPDRHSFLQFIYDIPAGIECLGAMPGRDGDKHDVVAQMELAETVNDPHFVDIELSYRFISYGTELLLRHLRVYFDLHAVDRFPLGLASYRANEGDDATD